MEIFNLTLTQMLVLFSLIIAGFLLKRKNILPQGSDSTVSRLETYIFMPALNFFNAMTNCTVETFRENSVLILYGGALTLAAVLISYPVSKLFIRNAKSDPKRKYLENVYKYALTFGNFGCVGIPVILAIWGGEFLFKFNMFTLGGTLLCNTWGLYVLIPKENNQSGLLKNILSGFTKPAIVAFLAGIVLGLLNLKPYVPEFLLSALSNASNCMGPIAMLLAGLVIGSYNPKALLGDVKIYILSLLRLIIIPGIMALILMLLNVSDEIITLTIFAFAAPLGLNTIIFPAAYGGDTKPGAAMTMISSTLAVVTIPIMYLIFVVIL